ncbi:hypothetical protein L7F22_051315 [Adiantum nelumboides]|nr:hypothetical protein [Adiantum nelumboides]
MHLNNMMDSSTIPTVAAAVAKRKRAPESTGLLHDMLQPFDIAGEKPVPFHRSHLSLLPSSSNPAGLPHIAHEETLPLSIEDIPFLIKPIENQVKTHSLKGSSNSIIDELSKVDSPIKSQHLIVHPPPPLYNIDSSIATRSTLRPPTKHSDQSEGTPPPPTSGSRGAQSSNTAHEPVYDDFYYDEPIICWCARCCGTYRRPRRECFSHQMTYGTFEQAPPPEERHRPMVHLLIHLVDEKELAGVVSTRWMFWAERFMTVLKGYVRQKARPEGSMAEGWMLEECMYYVCEYLERTDFEAPRVWTNESSSTMSNEVILKVDWFRAEYKGNSATMRRGPSKFWSVDSSKLMHATREPYIVPAHVEQAFFYKNPDSHPWWQVVHVQPRGRQLFDSVDPEEAIQDELITSSNLDTSTLETCRISLADHDVIVDDENDNHPYSDTIDTEEEEIVDA